MQASPLLTPTNYTSNSKKRSRASIDDDFDSHYLKKRLISTLSSMDSSLYASNPDDYYNRESCSPDSDDSTKGGFILTPSPMEESSTLSEHPVPIDDATSHHNRIHLIDVNGTLLPMEQKPGETKLSIPGFVISSDTNSKPLQPSSGQLILYKKNPILESIEKEQIQPQHIDDNDSVTSEENDEEYDPMDLDQ